MRVVTGTQMAAMDRTAIRELGIPGLLLMERAGTGVVRHLQRCVAPLESRRICIVCGKGNNGGDGFVVARLLWDAGIPSTVLLACAPEDLRGNAATNWGRLGRTGVEVLEVSTADELANLPASFGPGDLVVDALLGTGLQGEVRGFYRTLIEWINATGAAVVAVDIPSGVEADSGQVHGAAVRADLTVTMALPKAGHIVPPGLDHTGRLAVVDIGIPRSLAEGLEDAPEYIDDEAAVALLPRRTMSAHKGDAGRVFIVAGSTGLTGAAALAAEAAVRCGAGLVTVGCPASLHPILEVKTTEAMTVPLPDNDNGFLTPEALPDVRERLAGMDALAVGPGLGRAAPTGELVRRLLSEADLPAVVDADGLWACNGHSGVLAERKAPTVITPHPGEMAALLDCSIADVQADRLGIARETARRLGVVVVLKGACTVVAGPDGRVSVNGSGNPGMASGGMGDVLTGMVGALLGEGLEAGAAARLAAFLHGRAADLVAGPVGWRPVTAGETARRIGDAWDRVAAAPAGGGHGPREQAGTIAAEACTVPDDR